MSIGKEILESAADLLDQPGAWTQGEAALNESGGHAAADDHDACQWCLYGAVWHEMRLRGIDMDDTFSLAVEDYLLDRNLTMEWNDHPTREAEDVVAALRRVAQDCPV